MKVILDLCTPPCHENSFFPEVVKKLVEQEDDDNRLLSLCDSYTSKITEDISHELIVTLCRGDEFIWLDMLESKYPESSREVYAIKKEIRDKIIKGDLDKDGNIKIQLCFIKRPFIAENIEHMEVWFWSPSLLEEGEM